MEESASASTTAGSPATGPRTEQIALWLGVALYVLSFGLPMVAGFRMQGQVWQEALRGWQCAISLFFASLGGTWDADFLNLVLRLLGFLVALINPLAVTYVILRFVRNDRGNRQRIAFAVMVLIVLTWIFLAVNLIGPPPQRVRVGIGYVFWVVGLMLMMLRDAIRFFTAPEAPPKPGGRRQRVVPPGSSPEAARWHPKH